MSSTPKKAKMDECEVTGYIHRLSPFKGKKMNYFDCFIQRTDDSTNPELERIVGFSSQKKKELQIYQHNKTPVNLKTVQKQLNAASKVEYLVGGKTIISPTTSDIQPQDSGYTRIDLGQLNSTDSDYNLEIEYAVIGKVIKVCTIEQTNYQNLTRQDIIIGSGTNSTSLGLWGNLCNTVAIDQSIEAVPVKIRVTDNDSKYLTTTPNTIITPTPDVVVSEASTELTHLNQVISIADGQIISVKDIHVKLKCPTCNRSILSTQGLVIVCNSCNCATIPSMCTDVASCVLNVKSGGDIVQVTAFTETLALILNKTPSEVVELFKDKDIATLAILSCGRMSISYNKDTMRVTAAGQPGNNEPSTSPI